jgi:hypothetical protein
LVVGKHQKKREGYEIGQNINHKMDNIQKPMEEKSICLELSFRKENISGLGHFQWQQSLRQPSRLQQSQHSEGTISYASLTLSMPLLLELLTK